MTTVAEAHDRVTDALKAHGSRPGATRGMWRCPAHEDGTASLSVSNGDGKVLLHCHAGCTTDTILQAIGLTTRDLFDHPAETRGRAAILATYDYHDEDGHLLYQVVRLAPKDFRQRRPDGTGGWTWKLGDTRRVIYRLPAVLDAVRQGVPVWIVEGEKDVHAIEKAGGVATCNPGGAKKWRPEYADAFIGADITIVRDRDTPGHEHADQVRAALTGVARTIRTVEAAAGKDAADHLAEGLTLEQFTPIGDTPTDTDPTGWRPINLVEAGANPPAPPDLVHCKGGGALLYTGRRHLISGPPESLKSWVALIAAYETIGAGQNVVWIDTDGQGPADTLERLRAFQLTDHDITRHFIYFDPDQGTTEQEVNTLNTTHHPALVVVDSINPSMILHGLDPNQTGDVERFARTLVRPWGDATVILIDHVTKNPDNRGSYSYGSERKLGVVHVHLGLDVKERLSRDKPGRATIAAHKDRPGWHKRQAANHLGELTLTPSPAGIAYTVTLGSPRGGDSAPTSAMQDVSILLEQATDPLSQRTIEQGLKYRSETIRWALDNLIEHRFVRRSLKGRSYLHESIRPYRNLEVPSAE